MDRVNGGGEKKVGRQGIHTQLTLQSRSWYSTTCSNEPYSASCFQYLCSKLLQISDNSQKILSANNIYPAKPAAIRSRRKVHPRVPLKQFHFAMSKGTQTCQSCALILVGKCKLMSKIGIGVITTPESISPLWQLTLISCLMIFNDSSAPGGNLQTLPASTRPCGL